MAQSLIDTTAGAGDTAKAGGDKINANFTELFTRIAALEAGGGTTTPTVTLSAAQSRAEGNSGATAYTYTITRSAAVSPVNVAWSFAAGGTNAADYVGGTLPAGGTVAMGTGVLTGTFTVQVQGDATVEPDESFTVSITAPSGYGAGANMSATGTILNDDVASSAADLSTRYSTSFTGLTTYTPLRNNPDGRWASYSDDGSTVGQDRWYYQNEQIACQGADFQQPGRTFTAVDIGSAGAKGGGLRYKNVGSLIEHEAVYAGVDAANCLFGRLNTSAFELNRKVGGTITNLATVGGAWNGTIPTNAVVDFKVVDGYWEVFVNDVLKGAGSNAGAILGTRYGFGTFLDGAVIDDVSVYSLAGRATLSPPAQNFWASEFVNDGSQTSDYTGRLVPLSGTYSTNAGMVAPTAMQAQLRDLTTGAVVQAWTDMTGFVASAGAWSANIQCPAGGPYIPQVRFKNDTSVMGSLSPAQANQISVGGVTAYYGQSNAAYTYGIGSPDPALDAYTNAKTWSFNEDLLDRRTGTHKWEFGVGAQTRVHAHCRVMSDKFGIPWGAVGGGVGSRDAESLKPGGLVSSQDYDGSYITHWQSLTKQITVAGAIGRMVALVYDQGEAESEGTGVLDTTTFVADLTLMFDTFKSDLNAGRNSPTLITLTGRESTGVGTGQQDNNWPKIRAAEKNLSLTYTRGMVGHHNNGVTMGDTIHYGSGANGGLQKARRAALTLAYHLTGTGWPGYGPRMLTGTRSGAVITVPITANGAKSFEAINGETAGAGSASALTGWEVSADNFATLLTITSAVLSGSNVVVTLAATPSGAVKVRNHGHRNPNTTSIVNGVYSDGTRIAAEPIVIPLTVS